MKSIYYFITIRNQNLKTKIQKNHFIILWKINNNTMVNIDKRGKYFENHFFYVIDWNLKKKCLHKIG